MRYPTVDEIKLLHRQMIEKIGGSHGIRDEGALKSAASQPAATFGGEDLYPTIADKAAALAFSLVCNHPFVDGNKRVGHAAMELLLRQNGFRIECGIDEQEGVILQLAAGEMEREAFTEWVHAHVVAGTRGVLE